MDFSNPIRVSWGNFSANRLRKANIGALIPDAEALLCRATRVDRYWSIRATHALPRSQPSNIAIQLGHPQRFTLSVSPFS